MVLGRKGDFSSKQSANSTDITAMKHRCANLIAVAVVALPPAWSQASCGLSASPAALTFNYTINSTTLPPAAKLTVSLPKTASGATVISVSPTYPVGTPASQIGWLTVAPSFGSGPSSPLTVLAKPTGLPPGSYTANLSVTTNPNVGNLSVLVTLSIANPPASLAVSPGLTTANFTAASSSTPDTLSFTYITGSAWNVPASELDVSTSGGTIPFNVTAANAAGAASGGGTTAPVWLRVGPQGSPTPGLQTGGIAFAGSNVPILVSLDRPRSNRCFPAVMAAR